MALLLPRTLVTEAARRSSSVTKVLDSHYAAPADRSRRSSPSLAAFLEYAAVHQVSCDSHRPERMIPDLGTKQAG
jgi:hypothetical protein